MRADVATRRLEPLTGGDHDLMAYTATPDASRLAVTIGDDTHVGCGKMKDAVANAIGYAEHHSRSHDVPVSSSYQTESNEYTAAIDETLVSLKGFC